MSSGQSRSNGRVSTTSTGLSGTQDNALDGEDSNVRRFWKLRMRGSDDDLPQSWWFASTAIPLLAATLGPMANVLSIAALVTKWRDDLPNDGQLPEGADENGIGIPDPHWELVLNAISLAFGFAGNFCLLLNFTRRIRYIIVLPLSIIFWYLATAILMSILICMHKYDGPHRPEQTWSQGFWHAIYAATLYLIGSMILMINMLGYFLGHYPQHFHLDDHQRTLILQTMMFFFWLAGGAAVFSRVCGFTYADALYFCDVTVLTIGFGDFVATNDGGRGLVMPYSVIGIIFLGLMINSIRNFAISVSRDRIIRAHAHRKRERTIGRTVTSEKEVRERLGLPARRPSDTPRASSQAQDYQKRLESLNKYGDFSMQGRVITFHERKTATSSGRGGAGRYYQHSSKPSPKMLKALSQDENVKTRNSSFSALSLQRQRSRREKLLLLRDEKDRFDAMRHIQQNTRKFRQYYALSMSVLAFAVLWCMGALVFYFAEHREQDLSYFKALYFCYVSLLTIGYGDFSPKSNAGKPFFILWSLIAIPTMTILINDMGDTVVSAINRGTFTLADWTVMPREGVWHDFLVNHPKIYAWLQRKERERAEKSRIKKGFTVADPDDDDPMAPLGTTERPLTLEKLAKEKDPLSTHDLARKLALAIKHVAHDIQIEPPIKYNYEEWVEFTRLIRFSKEDRKHVEIDEEEEGLVEWDWIGDDSPMLAEVSESTWILDRLCESLNRYTKHQAREAKRNMMPERPSTRPGVGIRGSSDEHGRRFDEVSRSPGSDMEETGGDTNELTESSKILDDVSIIRRSNEKLRSE